MTELPTSPNNAEVETVREEIRSLLDFAVSQSVVLVPDPVIDEVLKALEHQAPWTVDKQAALWKMKNRLTALIKPATVESLKSIASLTKDQEKRPGFWRMWGKDPLARRQTFSSIAWVIVTVVVLVVGQFYALSISNILTGIDQAQKEWIEATAQVRQFELQIAADPSKSSALARDMDVWDGTAKTQESAIASGYALLDLWGVPFSWTVPVTEEGKFDQVGLRNVSLVFLKGFGLYLLPLLYGLFGANVYILRQLIVKLDSWSLNSISVTKHHLRRVLGAILGATVGLLFEDNDAIASIGFGLATMAFLAGYSSELVFSLLDTFITKAKQTFAPAKAYEPEQGPPPPAGGG